MVSKKILHQQFSGESGHSSNLTVIPDSNESGESNSQQTLNSPQDVRTSITKDPRLAVTVQFPLEEPLKAEGNKIDCIDVVVKKPSPAAESLASKI